MRLADAIMQGSSWFREARDDARQEGKADQARKLLRNFLRTRHPGLEQLPEIDAIQDLPALEALVEMSVSPAASRDTIEQAIRTAAVPSS